MLGHQRYVVAIGGTLGAGVRWMVERGLGPTDWPWAVLVANVVGSFVLGVVVVRPDTGRRELIRLGLGVGFCGGLTTFSSFALVVARFVDAGQLSDAISVVVATLASTVLAVMGGMRLGLRGSP